MKDVCTIKPGDTLFLECTVTEDDGTTPLNLTGWTIASQVRTKRGLLLADLTVDLHTPIAGQYSLRTDATTTWPTGMAEMDISYSDSGGRVMSTETLIVHVEHDVTHA